MKLAIRMFSESDRSHLLTMKLVAISQSNFINLQSTEGDYMK